MIFGLDIETIPDVVDESLIPQPKYGNTKDPKKREIIDATFKETGLIKTMSTDPFLCQAASIALYNPDKQIIYSQRNMSEKEMLTKFFEYIFPIPSHKIITQYGRKFDCKVLWARSVLFNMENVPVNIYYLWLRARWKTESTHVDIYEHYEKPLDFIAKRVLNEDKGDEGSRMVELVKSGKWDEIESYNMDDSRMAYKLAARAGLL